MPGRGLLVISFVRLTVTLSGRLLVKTRFLVVIAGFGVVSLCGTTLTAPSLVTPSLGSSWLGRAMRVALPTGVAHLFVVLGY